MSKPRHVLRDLARPLLELARLLADRRTPLIAGLRPYWSKVMYGLVCCMLSSILWWGHHTHWDLSFGLAGHGAAHAATSHQVVPSKPSAAEAFESAEVTTPALAESDNTSLELTQAIMHKAGIELGKIERQSMPQTISANGVVSHNLNWRAQLSSRVRGHVWRVERHVGDVVRKGEVLAIVDATEVGAAKGELLQALMQAELAQTTHDSLKNIESAIRGRQIREAEVHARDARIRTQVCAQALANMGLPVDLEQLTKLSDEERVKHMQFLGLPPHIVSKLDSATATSSLLPLVAPFDATVIGRELATGEVVSPDQPQIEIADIRRMWVMLEVRKEDVNLIRLGQPLEFIPDGMITSVQGKVDWISDSVDEKTRTLQVRAEVLNPLIDESETGKANHLLRANAFGTGKICVRSNDDALVAPTAAVQFDGRRHYVFIRRGERFAATAVEIGASDDGRTEILSGVQEGEIVATVGSHVLKAEMQLATAGS
jgi:multidrug efflux pump subunit AcrA (membrane-fusion protein)